MSYKSAPQQSMNDVTLMQESSGGFCLRSLQTGEEFPLHHEMLVGREVECQINLNTGHISRYHAKITETNNGIIVEDLRSTNGTFINGRRIHSPQVLSVGDEVRFHEQAFRLVSGRQESGRADATLFGSFNVKQATPASDARQMPADIDTPAPVAEEDGTQVLSSDDLLRLQGKAEREMKNPANGTGPRFVVLTAPIRGKVFSMRSQRDGWVLGRDESCQFNLFDKTVSGQHARVRKLANDWVLESCESRNPVYLNNRQVEFSTLQHGDVIRLGRMELMFRTDEVVTPEVEQPQHTIHASRSNIALVIGALAILLLVLVIVLV